MNETRKVHLSLRYLRDFDAFIFILIICGLHFLRPIKWWRVHVPRVVRYLIDLTIFFKAYMAILPDGRLTWFLALQASILTLYYAFDWRRVQVREGN